jgi:uncharacterized protein YoxC
MKILIYLITVLFTVSVLSFTETTEKQTIGTTKQTEVKPEKTNEATNLILEQIETLNVKKNEIQEKIDSLYNVCDSLSNIKHDSTTARNEILSKSKGSNKSNKYTLSERNQQGNYHSTEGTDKSVTNEFLCFRSQERENNFRPETNHKAEKQNYSKIIRTKHFIKYNSNIFIV